MKPPVKTDETQSHNFLQVLYNRAGIDLVSHINRGQGLCLLKQVSAFDKYNH